MSDSWPAPLVCTLRTPRPQSLDRERLRLALEQRTEQWKRELRAEVQVARLVLRRLVGPLTLWDESGRPDWCRWQAARKPEGLLDRSIWVASPNGTVPILRDDPVAIIRAA